MVQKKRGVMMQGGQGRGGGRKRPASAKGRGVRGAKGSPVEARLFGSSDPWVSYVSQTDAAQKLGFGSPTTISLCVLGKQEQTGGYEFRRKREEKRVVLKQEGGYSGGTRVTSKGGARRRGPIEGRRAGSSDPWVTYVSQSDAGRKLPVLKQSVSQCVLGKMDQTGGTSSGRKEHPNRLCPRPRPRYLPWSGSKL